MCASIYTLAHVLYMYIQIYLCAGVHITESQNCRCWKGLLEIIKSKTPARAGSLLMYNTHTLCRRYTHVHTHRCAFRSRQRSLSTQQMQCHLNHRSTFAQRTRWLVQCHPANQGRSQEQPIWAAVQTSGLLRLNLYHASCCQPHLSLKVQPGAAQL